MSKMPSPRADSLRAMREAAYEREQKALAAIKIVTPKKGPTNTTRSAIKKAVKALSKSKSRG